MKILPDHSMNDPWDGSAGFNRHLVVFAAMLAVFLGALDALIMGAAMPTIVSRLGGLDLYSWVFSIYMLTRSVSLPLFGKLADLYSSKKLFTLAIALFLIGSVLAGLSDSMPQLILCRALQGFGAGGNFALAYIVVSEISASHERGRMMGWLSLVWGVSSVLGPPLGGFIVSYWSWPWVFFINIPIGGAALICILRYFQETRPKIKAAVDYLGAAAFSTCILAFLGALLVGGETRAWSEPRAIGLFVLSLTSGVLFIYVERRAADPILPLRFFKNPGFASGNGAAFFSSFAVFSLLAFAPLFIQGVLHRNAAELGLVMIPLSLGWSAGALLCGQVVRSLGERILCMTGALLMLLGGALSLTFGEGTGLVYFSTVMAVTGLGMGFVSLGGLLKVQNSLGDSHLGIATSSQQFARTLGGSVGVGISGSLMSSHVVATIRSLRVSATGEALPAEVSKQLSGNIKNLLRPEMQDTLAQPVWHALQRAVAEGVEAVFWTTLVAISFTVVCCLVMPGRGEILERAHEKDTAGFNRPPKIRSVARRRPE